MTKDTGFYSLKVAKKVQETPEAVTVYFEVPEALKSKFTYKAGQYLTLKVPVNGSEERRSYSLSTSPGSQHPGVTVKKVKGGIVSRYLCDTLREADALEVMPPDGKFTVEPDAERSRTYYFFAAGSGITPLMSQIRTILEDEPMSFIYLYYGNRTVDSIIFYDELKELEEKYSGQLTITHILSRPKKGGLLGGIFGKKDGAQWLGETGRIGLKNIARFIEKNPKRTTDAVYHICGPGDMIVNVREALKGEGVPEQQIKAEYFTTPSDEKKKSVQGTSTTGTSKAIVTLRGERIEVEVGEKTILETLEDAGYDPPFSCTSGACATCMAKVVSGAAEMEMCFALSDDEVADGYILTCQSHPTTDEIEITYDV